MRYVTEAAYAGQYRLRVEFDDHVVKEVDLAPHLDGPVFEPLREADYFRSFRVDRDIDTVAWPNGADFAPEFLYEIGHEVLKADGLTTELAEEIDRRLTAHEQDPSQGSPWPDAKKRILER